MVSPGAAGGGDGGVSVLQVVSVWEDESSRDGWWGQPHNTVNVLKATELDTLKWLKIVKFMLSKLYHNFNKR